MIKVYNHKDKITISGHANYNEKGQDIVCSSVSSIVMTTINAINSLEEGAIKSVVKEGYIEIIILNNSLIVTKLLENMAKFLELDIQLFAHKKGQSSTSNGRDSAGRRLGAKAADGEYISAGSIIYRQRGTKIHPGENVGRGTDDTLYAKVSGYVKYEHYGKDRKKVSVYLEK